MRLQRIVKVFPVGFQELFRERKCFTTAIGGGELTDRFVLPGAFAFADVVDFLRTERESALADFVNPFAVSNFTRVALDAFEQR